MKIILNLGSTIYRESFENDTQLRSWKRSIFG